MTLYANTKLATEIADSPSPINFAGMANDLARVQYCIDLLSAETADNVGTADLTNRQYMDQISPRARVSLIAMLTKLKANVT